MMQTVSNADFLTAIFGEDAPFVHVTDFCHDPSDIPSTEHLRAWSGNYFSRYHFQPVSNQYFTISCFYADDDGKARRRKALYRHTPCIVLDDVREKLSMDEVSKLPAPSWILETSPGSEQWGYILNEKCQERHRVENLLDGLVANGLAPDGRDPGMKGVTRYVRLPDGHNNKASKMIDGKPYKCVMRSWSPFSRVTLDQLADPFNVDLDAVRREARVDGASDVGDHPILQVPDVVHVKEIRSAGRFDVTCPWVDEHTGADDSGAAVFTNKDGTIGFKCHHGACQTRTGADLLRHIESHRPGFKSSFAGWKMMREMSEHLNTETPVTFDVPAAVLQAEPSPVAPSFLGEVPTLPTAPVADTPTVDGVQTFVDALRRERPDTPKARELSSLILKHVEEMPAMERMHWHDQVSDLMHWSKADLKLILKELRSQWYGEKVTSAEFYDDFIFVAEQNQFYCRKTRIFYTAEAFQNAFCHIDSEARKIALQDGRVVKVDKLDYAPKKEDVFEERGVKIGNTWCGDDIDTGVMGDVTRWLDHFEVLGWGSHAKHVMQWMAYTLRHPERKINHVLLMGSREGAGKDFILYPLQCAMHSHYTVISGEELISDFNEYTLGTKYLHINEAELGDRREAQAVSNKLKPLAAAPPDTLRVNPKGVRPVQIRNIVNATMTTNSHMPLKLNGPSRRFYAIWSDFTPRDSNDNMKPEWKDYWEDRWTWMRDNQGWRAVAWYLMNCVDLSDFNPGEAPPITEFMRDIREASKSPMQQTIDAFIRERIGVFKCDLMTSTDMVSTLKSGPLIAPDHMHVDTKFFTPVRVGQVMREVGAVQLRAYYLGTPVRLWAVRDVERYQSMSSGELYNEYYSQQTLAAKTASVDFK